MVAALHEAGQDAHFTIHTDMPRAFTDCFGGHSYECRRVEPGSEFPVFLACHGEVLRDARIGEFVALLDGDHLVSREFFDACESQFARGKRLVMANGVRTLWDNHPPAGSTAAEVNEFIFQKPHPITTDLTWPNGKSSHPSLMFFRDAENLVAHCFHLHPIAFVMKLGDKFDVSVDQDLPNGFSRDEIHIVTDPNELAIAEMSPADRTVMSNSYDTTAETIASWAAAPPDRTTAMHRWFFRHSIVHKGSAEAFDLSPVNEILDRLHEPTLWAKATPQ